MKTKNHLSVTGRLAMASILSSALLILPARVAVGQTVQLIPFAPSAGGGRSHGDQGTLVAGTIGQAFSARSRSAGREYAVQSGIQGIVTLLQSLGAPRLSLERTAAGDATLRWSSGTTNWTVQQTSALAPRPEDTVWSNLPTAPVSIDGTFQVAIPLRAENRFFRLYRLSGSD